MVESAAVALDDQIPAADRGYARGAVCVLSVPGEIDVYWRNAEWASLSALTEGGAAATDRSPMAPLKECPTDGKRRAPR